MNAREEDGRLPIMATPDEEADDNRFGGESMVEVGDMAACVCGENADVDSGLKSCWLLVTSEWIDAAALTISWCCSR